MPWTPPEAPIRTESGRVPGALHGSLLLEQPEHRADAEAFRAFLDLPGPVALEVGVDTATVLFDNARREPDTRWIGLELRRRKVLTARPAAPANVLLWWLDARTVLANLIPDGRLSRVDILFPTPTTKPRHLLFTEGFVADLRRALTPHGVLTVATDVPELWQHIHGLLSGWHPTPPPPRGEVRSRRERVCRREGLTVYGGSFTPPAGADSSPTATRDTSTTTTGSNALHTGVATRSPMMFAFDNTYAHQLTGLYEPATPDVPPDPKLVALNTGLAQTLGLDPDALRDHGARWLSGAELPEGAQPIAQAYAGHQFGGLSPRLGDGRAVLLGELVTPTGDRVDLHLKGTGRTSFSRGGDGKAALGPMLREYVIGEAMFALGVPTTRMLAVVATGEQVYRARPLPGAVVARVAASHLRIGTFEYFAIRQDHENLTRLLHYALARHGPADHGDNPALTLLRAVGVRQAALVAQWMGLGFIHGVMNTDNVTISGETIDYGPCAFMDAHDPTTVFSSIDHAGRYAYGQQPRIAGWNLTRLASALLPLIHSDAEQAVDLAQGVIDGFQDAYQQAWAAVMTRKLGLLEPSAADAALARELTALMAHAKADHTLTFRALSAAARGDRQPFLQRFDGSEVQPEAEAWCERWLMRLTQQGGLTERAAALDAVNPRYIPRNHLVEDALEAGEAGDLDPFRALLDAVTQPYTERPGLDAYASPAPPAFTACYQTFCGT